MTTVSYEDFYKVPDLKFDISRLRKDLEKVLEQKNFQQKLEKNHYINLF